MKVSPIPLALLALITTEVAAFPSLAEEHMQRLAQTQKGKRSTLAKSSVKKRVSFDAKSQYVSTTGKHAFVSPNFAAGDVRGPCPGNPNFSFSSLNTTLCLLESCAPVIPQNSHKNTDNPS
jgi:hypothetical protein